MGGKHTLFVVDDNRASRQIIETALCHSYTIEAFESGQACLDRLGVETPSLLLLDVQMPGMDGYELCRHIRNDFPDKSVPIIFVSGLNDLDSHLAGYDAGGDDFIEKPLNFPELMQKIEALLRVRDEQLNLRHQIEESETLTSLILSNLDEYAVLVKFLRSLNDCEQYSDIAHAILGMLDAYHLDGVVQFRLKSFELTINQAGEVKPLEASIINQVRTMGTIAEYKTRAAFNFKHISVMVNNMPVAEPDLCGRLRDHLAISVETADSKILAIATHQENFETKSEISSLLNDLNNTVHEFREKYEKARHEGAIKSQELITDLDSEFANLGMREVQEDSIKGLVLNKTDELVGLFDFSAATENTLNALSERLGNTL